VVSSTKIRELLHEGNVVGARLLLGRAYDVDGVVVRGAGRGRSIGIPTANLAVEGELLPRPGVYAGKASLLGDAGVEWTRPAAVNLGFAPTFGRGLLSLEAHVIEGLAPDVDLTDRRLRVAFHARLRGEERFPDVAALVAQIKKDIDEAKTRLQEEP
jgi:riboflavin kinase/FMN adenylyltransferase